MRMTGVRVMEIDGDGRVGNKLLGALLRQYRTQAGLTQEELAEASHVQRAYIGNIELGRNSVIYPDKFKALHRVLRFPAWEMLETMGYPTDFEESDIDARLLILIRQLTPDQQRALAEVVRSMFKAGGG